MAKGYWMFHVTVNDPDTYQKYIEHDAPVFASTAAVSSRAAGSSRRSRAVPASAT